MAPLTVSWALLYQSSVQKISHRQAHRPIWWRQFFSWGFFSSYVTLVCATLELVRTKLHLTSVFIFFSCFCFVFCFSSPFQLVLWQSAPLFSYTFHADFIHKDTLAIVWQSLSLRATKAQGFFSLASKTVLRYVFIICLLPLELEIPSEYFLKSWLGSCHPSWGILQTWYEYTGLSVDVPSETLKTPWNPVKAEASMFSILAPARISPKPCRAGLWVFTSLMNS